MVGVNYNIFRQRIGQSSTKPPSPSNPPAKAPPPLKSIGFPPTEISDQLTCRYPFLRDYQDHAARIIKSRRACLAGMGMGLGKTLTTISVLVDLAATNPLGRVLVVAPPRVAEEVWEQEIKIWDFSKHLRVARLLGTPKQRIKTLDADADVFLITFDTLHWLVSHYEEQRRPWDFGTLIIDESTFVKSQSTNRWKALKRVRHLPARIILLSGKPAPNSLLDLWSQIYVLDGGARLGKYFSHYRERYFYPTDPNGWGWEIKQGAEKDIYKAIEDIAFFMKSEDYLDVPPISYNRIHVTLPTPALKQYRELKRDMLLQFQESKAETIASNAAVLVGKLQQVANGFAYTSDGGAQVIHDAKITALREIYEAAAGRPMLVAYHYQHDRDRILAAFPDARTLDHPNAVDLFNGGKIPMLVMHPASGGHGLNLQKGGADIVVWYGPIHSLDKYDQTNARLYRTGQRNAVVVHHIIAKGTIDEAIMSVLAAKDETQQGLINALKISLNAV